MSIEKGKLFPFLHTEPVCATNGDLQFRVHLKPNQQLKCPNASTPLRLASRPSFCESAKDCPNRQQSRKQTRTCPQTKSAHNTQAKNHSVPTMNATGGEQPAFVSDAPTSVWSE